MGPKQRLLVGLALGCVIAILLSILACLRYGPTAGQAGSDEVDEVYEVYAAAIQDLFLKGPYKFKIPDDLDERLVVIQDHTIPCEWEAIAEPYKRTHEWPKLGLTIDDGTLEDFKLRCKYSVSLEPRFTFPAQKDPTTRYYIVPARQVVISDDDFKDSFRDGPDWNGFYARYPNSIGYIKLSQVGFNSEHDQAFLYVMKECGNRCGQGYYVFAAKIGSAWSIVFIDGLWIA